MNEIEIIKDMYKKYWEYMISKNLDGLKELLSVDYYLLHMTGTKQSTTLKR